jgi:hypothetical protein
MCRSRVASSESSTLRQNLHLCARAGVAKSVDAADLKSSDRKVVQVRSLSPAPVFSIHANA